MYCKKCGGILKENDLFCPNCGARVQNMSGNEEMNSNVIEQQETDTIQQDFNNQSYSNVQQPNDYNYQNNVQQPNDYNYQDNVQQSNNNKQPNKKKSNNILIFICVIVVIAILLAGIVFFINTFILRKDDKEEENNNNNNTPITTNVSLTSNINNSGTITTTSNSNESTYKVTHSGYTFEIPEKYEYLIQDDKLFVGNTDDDVRWTLALIPIEGITFNQIESKKDYFENYFGSNLEIGTTSIDYIGGVNYFIVPFDYPNGISGLTGYANLGSSAIVSYEVDSPDEKPDKNILYDISPIISSAQKADSSDTTASIDNKDETRRLEADEEIEGFESMDKAVKAVEESKNN